MLILQRRRGQSIEIGDPEAKPEDAPLLYRGRDGQLHPCVITVTYHQQEGKILHIGFDAAPEVPINRPERLKRKREQATEGGTVEVGGGR